MEYAPYLDVTIPALVLGDEKIPYKNNPAISLDQILGFHIQIKYLNSTEVIISTGIGKGGCSDTMISVNGITGDNKLTPGQFYQVQIAYRFTDNTTGPWSSAAIVKYIGYVGIEKFSGSVNTSCETSVDISDPTEPITEYRYTCYDPLGAEAIGSGWLKGNGNTCEWVNNIAIFDFSSYIQSGNTINYNIKFEFKTLNGYEYSEVFKPSFNKFLIYTGDSGPSIVSYIQVGMEEGAAHVEIFGNTSGDNPVYLLRTQDRFKWDILDIYENVGQRIEYVDRNLESGETYFYANASHNMDTMLLEVYGPVTIKFEDIFLSDKDRQLRIRFNPKVPSFKTTVLESKTDTIGGKYPFFFRNGNVEYKEFPINGLISYWMDEQEDFISWSTLGLDDDTKLPTTNLTDYNIAAERKMKLEVLKWLNNGKPKLFRSPAEGNYLVRLMNVSLSPEDKLSRMIHSFSATAYECGPTTTESLRENGIIPEVDNG